MSFSVIPNTALFQGVYSTVGDTAGIFKDPLREQTNIKKKKIVQALLKKNDFIFKMINKWSKYNQILTVVNNKKKKKQ